MTMLVQKHSLMSFTPAFRVPPVAIRSSISTTLCPGCTAPSCISILSVLYSVAYSSDILGPAPGKLDLLLNACQTGRVIAFFGCWVNKGSHNYPALPLQCTARTWELSWLAERDKWYAKCQSQGCPKYQASSLKACAARKFGGRV